MISSKLLEDVSRERDLWVIMQHDMKCGAVRYVSIDSYNRGIVRSTTIQFLNLE